MKTTKPFMCICLIEFCLFVVAGCSNSQSPSAANEIRCSLTGISDVAISYDEEPITFYQAEGDELIIKEYMTENRSSYYAAVKQSGDSIHISEGGKPFFKSGFSRRIEVFLPASYMETLKITTTDGDIDLSNVNYEEVTGDLYFFNKNENINLTLPDNLSFEFEATTKNGSVSTTFGECITVDGHTIRGIVGDNPTVSVKTETNNGNIEVSQ